MAVVVAVVSCFFVPPNAGYLDYINWKTLAVLYCMMVVVSGLKKAGVLEALAYFVISKANSIRVLQLVLVGLCFFTGIFITNDVAILTFVPFTIVTLRLVHEEKRLPWIIPLQMIAANIGSFLLPIGNPHNLYFYELYSVPVGTFILYTVPVWAAGGLILAVICSRAPKARVNVELEHAGNVEKKSVIIYGALFLINIMAVLKIYHFIVMLAIVLIAVFIYDKKTLIKCDFILLATFTCFFIFAGNISEIPAVEDFFIGILGGREYYVTAILCQFISNVPSSFLLGEFTQNACGMILGADVGGLGTPIASMCSLIGIKMYMAEKGEKGRHFWGKFLGLNFGFLLGLSAFITIIGYA